MSDMWSGPREGRHQINPIYIDAGLDPSTWARMRALRAPQDMEVVTARSELSGYVPPGVLEPANDAIAVEMGSTERLVYPWVAQEMVGANGWVANSGECVQSIDWVPERPDGLCSPGDQAQEEHADYIAVGGLGPGTNDGSGMNTVLAKRDKSPGPGSIQIWRLDIDPEEGRSSRCRLDIVLLHDFGRCVALKWCPIGMDRKAGTMGLLAAIFGDGSLRICAVPTTRDSLHSSQLSAGTAGERVLPGALVDPVFVRWPRRSLMETRAPHGMFTVLQWATCDVLLAGTSKGVLTVWEVGSIIANLDTAPRAATSGPPSKLIPIANHQIHKDGPVLDLSTYCLGSKPKRQFDYKRDSSGFRQLGLSDIQVVSLGTDGRLRQIPLLFTHRSNAPLQSIPRRVLVAQAYWLSGSCIYSDADKNMRVLQYEALRWPGDPWLKSMSGNSLSRRENTDEGVRWNQRFDRHSIHVHGVHAGLLQASVSDLHPFVGLAKSDGELIVSNMNILRVPRHNTAYYVPLYRLYMAKDHYLYEGRKPIRGEKGSTRVDKSALFMPEVAVVACAWSRSPRTAHWIASATANGLLRIESASPVGVKVK
ncbi:hypothetical protein GGF46_003618 [Coemansia sp. RSA 552]|nr:hypothetical protein GGF46_003618 [Coemansia sp. RSA 552]